MPSLSHDRIRSELRQYGTAPDDALCRAILTYIELLLKWNAKISLTAVTDPLEILRIHFGESVFGATKLRVSNGRLADVGTGAGFPGIPLRMVSPQLDLFLIEPNVKKAAFLAEVVRALRLDRVEILRSRIEDLPVNYAYFRVITARALGRYENLLRWAKNRLSDDGCVALWLGEEDAASLSANSTWDWSAPIRVPGSDRRIILEGKPKRP
jgi:16S rRNA (guanine527-N7)-methyltransferase